MRRTTINWEIREMIENFEDEVVKFKGASLNYSFRQILIFLNCHRHIQSMNWKCSYI